MAKEIISQVNNLNKINSIDTFVKYIEYLIDYADMIYSQETLTENNYIALWKEVNLFHKRISVSEIIPDTIKSELLKIKLPQTKKEFSIAGIIRLYYYKLLPQLENSIDKKIENQLRENVKDFRNRLDNIFYIIKVKS